MRLAVGYVTGAQDRLDLAYVPQASEKKRLAEQADGVNWGGVWEARERRRAWYLHGVRELSHQLPLVDQVDLNERRTSNLLNLAGRSAARVGMCRSPKVNTSMSTGRTDQFFHEA